MDANDCNYQRKGATKKEEQRGARTCSWVQGIRLTPGTLLRLWMMEPDSEFTVYQQNKQTSGGNTRERGGGREGGRERREEGREGEEGAFRCCTEARNSHHQVSQNTYLKTHSNLYTNFILHI